MSTRDLHAAFAPLRFRNWRRSSTLRRCERHCAEKHPSHRWSRDHTLIGCQLTRRLCGAAVWSVTSWALCANSSVRGSAPFPRYSAPTRCMPISQWRRNHRHTCLGKSQSCFALAFALNCASDGSAISFQRPLFCLRFYAFATIGAASFPDPSTFVTFRDDVCRCLCVVYDLTEACVCDILWF